MRFEGLISNGFCLFIDYISMYQQKQEVIARQIVRQNRARSEGGGVFLRDTQAPEQQSFAKRDQASGTGL
jgi:hypothetical protein